MAACQLAEVPPGGNAPSGSSESAPIAIGGFASGPDVAVTAVDFEPPLRSGSNLSGKDISLLVAVENKGVRRETDIRLEAQILGGEDELLYSDSRLVDGLAAGEGKVVQFGRLSGLPLRSTYTIKVWAGAVAGESRLENNAKTYRVQISLSPS